MLNWPTFNIFAVYTGCRMAFYEWIRENVLGKNPDGSFPVWYGSFYYVTYLQFNCNN